MHGCGHVCACLASRMPTHTHSLFLSLHLLHFSVGLVRVFVCLCVCVFVCLCVCVFVCVCVYVFSLFCLSCSLSFPKPDTRPRPSAEHSHSNRETHAAAYLHASVVTVCCSVLLHTLVCVAVLQHTVAHSNTLQHTATHYSCTTDTRATRHTHTLHCVCVCLSQSLIVHTSRMSRVIDMDESPRRSEANHPRIYVYTCACVCVCVCAYVLCMCMCMCVCVCVYVHLYNECRTRP